jgi:hypothetical protein
MDLWGLCPNCERWFYAGESFVELPGCPVCGSTATRVEDRAMPAGAA